MKPPKLPPLRLVRLHKVEIIANQDVEAAQTTAITINKLLKGQTPSSAMSHPFVLDCCAQITIPQYRGHSFQRLPRKYLNSYALSFRGRKPLKFQYCKAINIRKRHKTVLPSLKMNQTQYKQLSIRDSIFSNK